MLTALTGNGSSSGQKQAVSQQEKNALRAVKLHPSDANAWGQLVSARWTSATQGSNYDPNTGVFTAAGKKELAGVGQAWQQYLKLTNKPDPNVAILAARANARLGAYAAEAAAWEIVSAGNPKSAIGFECLSASAYAAKQTRKGDLARDKALTLVPAAQRTTLRQQLSQAKTNPQVAASC